MSKIQFINQKLGVIFKNKIFKISIPILIILLIFLASTFYLSQKNADKKFTENNETPGLIRDEFALKEPEFLPNTSFDIKYSPIENTSDKTNNTNNLINPNLQNYSIILDTSTNSPKGNSLSFFNYQTKTITLIDENIERAKFIDSTKIIYLKIDSGIYLYNISDNSKKLIINSLDPQTIDNIAFIDDSNFFIISSQTGKIGFGKIGDSNLRIIDQKLIQTSSNYAKLSAYRLPKISPNKKYLAFYDMTTNNNLVSIIVLPINATKLSDKILEVSVENISGNFNSENVIEWSNSSNLLRAGQNSIIDISTKKVIFKAESTSQLNYFSPDEKNILEINITNGESKIINFNTNTSQVFPSYSSQINWINQNRILLIILNKVYVFDLQKNSLEKILDQEDDYTILNSNLIQTPKQIIELSEKQI